MHTFCITYMQTSLSNKAGLMPALQRTLLLPNRLGKSVWPAQNKFVDQLVFSFFHGTELVGQRLSIQVTYQPNLFPNLCGGAGFAGKQSKNQLSFFATGLWKKQFFHKFGGRCCNKSKKLTCRCYTELEKKYCRCVESRGWSTKVAPLYLMLLSEKVLFSNFFARDARFFPPSFYSKFPLVLPSILRTINFSLY